MQDKYKVRVQEKSMVPPVSLRSNQVEIQDRYKVRQQEKIMVTLDPRTNKKGVFRRKMKLQETKQIQIQKMYKTQMYKHKRNRTQKHWMLDMSNKNNDFNGQPLVPLDHPTFRGTEDI